MSHGMRCFRGPTGEIGLGSRNIGHAVDATNPGGGGIPALPVFADNPIDIRSPGRRAEDSTSLLGQSGMNEPNFSAGVVKVVKIDQVALSRGFGHCGQDQVDKAMELASVCWIADACSARRP